MHNLKHPAAIDRRTFLRLTAGAGAGVALAACGGGGSAPVPGGAEQEGAAVASGGEYSGPAVELAFWNGFTGADGPVMGDLVEQFNSEHDNIAVAQNTQQWADFYASVPTAVTSGNGPDVAIMHIDQLATNAARNVIIPLDPIAEGLGMEAANFPEEVWNGGIYNDQRFGLPLDIHPLGFYYNKDLMEQAGLDPDSPPQDMDSYMAALEAFKGEDIRGMWVSPFLFTGGLSFEALVWQFGGQLFSEDGMTATFNEQPGVDALTWMRSLVEDGHSPANVDQDADHIAFQNGENAFHWNGIWQAAAYRDTDGLNWGVAPLPQIGSQKAAWAGSHNFVITSQADENQQQAAGTFISWIIDHSLDWAAAGQVPANQEVREDPEFEELEVQSTLAEQLDYVQFPPSIPGIGGVIDPVMVQGYQVAILGRKEPQKALDDAANQANQLLEENRSQYGGG